MDAYPSQYTEHNLPLVVLSGLGESQDESQTGSPLPRQESGTKLSCSSQECDGERAQSLLQQFLRLDGRAARWNAQSLSGPSGALKYRMKAIGRAYTLPPRKAAPLAQSPSTEGVPTLPAKAELHSPLSPLSPGSPIFPDGLFTPAWFSKHQQQVPCLFLAFFDVSAGDSSKDEQIKADINIVRTSLSRSGFKTRFAAVLLSDRSILQAPDLEERLSSIRRLTSLDSKTGLFFMPPMSSNAEIATFVQSIMTTLQPLCVEHYRELTKHARRKKARGGPPPSASAHSGAGSQSLSTSGWNTRYEAKQGVFAEIRQEMDVAERHYGAAIDELFSSEGIFEVTASWSPRWEEARLFCDALAIRTLRCQLWVSQTTGAVQSWINYRARMKDLIDRRGKGSQTYGFAAWEARWAEVMAQLTSRADVAVQRAPDGRDEDEGEGATMQFHMMPEKSFTGADRLRPFQMLHHSGYWLKVALEGARERRKRAMAIPDEDRIPPGQSPASAVANRVRNYDLYLVPDPHQEATYDHVQDIQRLTELSVDQFEIKGQGRMMELLKLNLAKDLIETGRHQVAREMLLPLWESSTWRQEDWHELFGELAVLLNKCAGQEHLSDNWLVVSTAYELVSVRDPELSGLVFPDSLDLASDQNVSLKCHDHERVSPIALAFAFGSAETHVGETLECQLNILCRAKQGTKVRLSHVILRFGSSRTVKVCAIEDRTSLESEREDAVVALSNPVESSGSLEGQADLRLMGGQKRTVSFNISLREAGTLRLTEASFSIRDARLEIEHSFSEETILAADSMLAHTDDKLQRRHLPRAETTVATVLPKPPKLKLLIHGLHKKYYTGELVRLVVELINEEADAVEGQIAADAKNEDDASIAVSWTEIEQDEEQVSKDLAQVNFSTLDAAASRKFILLVRAPSRPTAADLTVLADYNLSSDGAVPLKKTMTLDMNFARPFEAQYNFGPVLYPSAWPSYFDPGNGASEDSPGGIPQLWRLGCQLRSLAADRLLLHSMEIVKEHVSGDSTCTVRERGQDGKTDMGPGEMAEEAFQLRTQKNSLEDRRPTVLESSLLITWSRESESFPFTTSLQVPRLTLPVSEPRVLCTLSEESPSDVDATLHYHIENSSTHFLTFAITMEASEDFAFGGPKYRTLSLAPLSRHRVEYNINLYDDAIAGKESGRWVWPSLQVTDSYYQKSLKVHPAGPDVKMDEKGAIGVWVEL